MSESEERATHAAIRRRADNSDQDDRFEVLREPLRRMLDSSPSPRFRVSLSAQIDDGRLISTEVMILGSEAPSIGPSFST